MEEGSAIVLLREILEQDWGEVRWRGKNGNGNFLESCFRGGRFLACFSGQQVDFYRGQRHSHERTESN